MSLVSKAKLRHYLLQTYFFPELPSTPQMNRAIQDPKDILSTEKYCKCSEEEGIYIFSEK